MSVDPIDRDDTDDADAYTDGVGSNTSQHTRPSVTDATDNSRTPTDDLDLLKSLPVRVWVLPLAAIAIFLPWATVAVPALGIEQSVTGSDTDSGLVLFVILGVIVTAELLPFTGKRLKQAWHYGGIAYILVALVSLWHIRSEFQSAQADLASNPFGGAVQMDIGIALYATLVLGILIAYFGFQMDARYVRSTREIVD